MMPFYQVYADAGDFSIKNRSGRRQHAAVDAHASRQQHLLDELVDTAT